MKTHSPPNKARQAVVCCAGLLLAQAAWAQLPLQTEFRIDGSAAQPMSLGELLLTGQRGKKPVQMMMLIWLVEDVRN